MRRAIRVFSHAELADIYYAWKDGLRLIDLAAKYNVSYQTIHRAVNKYEATLPLHKRMTKDEMRIRRIRMDDERRRRARNGDQETGQAWTRPHASDSNGG